MPAKSKHANSSGGLQRTPLVVVPNRDFPALAAGTKTEFRQPWVGDVTKAALRNLPIPIVAYTRASGYGGARRCALMVCERFWKEPLGAIAASSIEAEGFANAKEFRAYWRRRFRHGRFDRYNEVWCFEVRPYRAEQDEQRFKDELYERLILEPYRRVRADQQS